MIHWIERDCEVQKAVCPRQINFMISDDGSNDLWYVVCGHVERKWCTSWQFPFANRKVVSRIQFDHVTGDWRLETAVEFILW